MLDGSKAGIVYLDTMVSSGEKQPIYCLRIRDEVHHSRISVPYGLHDHLAVDGEKLEQMIMGLALAHVPDSPNTYTRIGLVRFMKLSCFDGMDVVELVMI